MSDPAAAEIDSAKQAVSDARVLRNHGGSSDAIANRLYYACYHAAKAVLYTKGHQPKSHAGVISLFGEELVKNGEASQADRNDDTSAVRLGRHENSLIRIEQFDVSNDVVRIIARTDAVEHNERLFRVEEVATKYCSSEKQFVRLW